MAKMQATLILDDDIFTEAERLARERSVSVDVVVSDLLRQSLMRLPTVRPDNGFPIFRRTPGAPVITAEDVRRAGEES